MVARGEVVQRVIRESGFSVTWVAQRIGISRQQLYSDFGNPEMTFDRILAIGKVLHYDFSQDFQDLPASYVQLLGSVAGNRLQDCQAKLLEVQSQLITALQQLARYQTKYGSSLD